MSDIEVKALEWGHYDSGAAFAYTSVGLVYFAHPDGSWCMRNGDKTSVGETLEAAKAAAQSDYDARIRSAIVEPRVTDTSITKLYMEAAKAYRGYDHDFNGDGLMAAVKTVAAALSASPSPVDSRELVERLVKDIVRGVCELQELPDPDHPDTIMVTVDDLEAVVTNHLAALAAKEQQP